MQDQRRGGQGRRCADAPLNLLLYAIPFGEYWLLIESLSICGESTGCRLCTITWHVERKYVHRRDKDGNRNHTHYFRSI